MSPPPDPDKEQRRSRLYGRLVILGFGLLLAAYLVPMFWGLLWPAKD